MLQQGIIRPTEIRPRPAANVAKTCTFTNFGPQSWISPTRSPGPRNVGPEKRGSTCRSRAWISGALPCCCAGCRTGRLNAAAPGCPTSGSPRWMVGPTWVPPSFSRPYLCVEGDASEHSSAVIHSPPEHYATSASNRTVPPQTQVRSHECWVPPPDTSPRPKQPESAAHRSKQSGRVNGRVEPGISGRQLLGNQFSHPA